MGYRTEKQKKTHRESMKRAYAANPEKFKQRVRKWQKENNYSSIYTTRWRKSHREIARARYAVSDAVKSGKIQRPDKCQSCGVSCRPEAHHHKGYEKEFRLDVLWLCGPCHRRIHGKKS